MPCVKTGEEVELDLLTPDLDPSEVLKAVSGSTRRPRRVRSHRYALQWSDCGGLGDLSELGSEDGLAKQVGTRKPDDRG